MRRYDQPCFHPDRAAAEAAAAPRVDALIAAGEVLPEARETWIRTFAGMELAFAANRKPVARKVAA